MKKFFAVLVLFALSACVPSSPPSRTVTTTVAWRDFSLVLHADNHFNELGRRIIVEAAENIRRLTHGRARLDVVFDLDFDSIENLKAHMAANHSMVFGVLSDYDVVKTLDEGLRGPGTILAATVETKSRSQFVFLILDRIAEDKFSNVVTHEFGHVIGFPDLDAMGAIMSGRSASNEPAILDWAEADLKLCREFHYCD